jgi:uncharacterized repeat protein (TIGR01451 family)
MVFRREGTYAMAALVLVFAAAMLFAAQAWAQPFTIDKAADQTSVDVGEELTYEIIVRNTNATRTDPPIDGLEIRDILPDNVNFVHVREGRNVEDCPRPTDDEVRCTLNPLAPGDRARLDITIRAERGGGNRERRPAP